MESVARSTIVLLHRRVAAQVADKLIPAGPSNDTIAGVPNAYKHMHTMINQLKQTHVTK